MALQLRYLFFSTGFFNNKIVIPVAKEPANNAPMNAHGLVIVATANIPDAGIRLSVPYQSLIPLSVNENDF